MRTLLMCFIVMFILVSPSPATVTQINGLPGSSASGYSTEYPEPLPFKLDANGYNDGILYVWDERQNVKLASDLPVDRVYDDSAPYITGTSGNYMIKKNTIVSSHYIQWDPHSGTVEAELTFDSAIFAFITEDQKLFSSDSVLGHPDIDYSDFGARGLEGGDYTTWGSTNKVVNIDWYASDPGDWTRLITAYSPAAEEDNGSAVVPAPGAFLLAGLGTGLVGYMRRRRSI